MNNKKYIITKTPNSFLFDLKEIWKSKFIIYEFAKKELKTSYAQTVIGPFYFVLLPLIQAIILNFFMNNITNKSTIDGYPSFIFCLLGTTVWNLCSTIVTKNSGCLLLNRKLITRTYVNKLIFYLSGTIISFVHFLTNFLLLVGILIYYKYYISNALYIEFSYKLLFLPLILFYITILCFSVGAIISCISIRYRDVVYGVPFIISMFFFISPVLFSAKSGKLFSFIFSINPISSVMEYFRWVFLVDYTPLNDILISNLIMTISLFFLSIYVFKKTENKIADLL